MRRVIDALPCIPAILRRAVASLPTIQVKVTADYVAVLLVMADVLSRESIERTT
jgi:hypothetical protein